MNTRGVALVSIELLLAGACSRAAPPGEMVQGELAETAAGHSASGTGGAPASAESAAPSAGARSAPTANTAAGAAAVRSPMGGAGARAESPTGGQMAAAGSAGNAAADGCSRELLQRQVDAYFVALAAHDPAALPLADDVRFTENGEALELGKAGLWTSAGALQHAHSALDTEACTAVAQAIVPDGSTPIPVALRLKLVSHQITEIETIAVRDGDYMLRSDTEALRASAQTVQWQDSVPADQRNTREELIAWMDKYFRMFPRGVCDTTSACKRIENGGGDFNCSAGASCASGAPGGSDRALVPRLILADVETGVGVGFTMFQSNTDMHIFKMSGGEVHGVSAILAKADSSGWD
jgi:hypothetical protein